MKAITSPTENRPPASIPYPGSIIELPKTNHFYCTEKPSVRSNQCLSVVVPVGVKRVVGFPFQAYGHLAGEGIAKKKPSCGWLSNYAHTRKLNFQSPNLGDPARTQTIRLLPIVTVRVCVCRAKGSPEKCANVLSSDFSSALFFGFPLLLRFNFRL